MKLVLLRCPNCSEPLTPGNDDIVVTCTNCFETVAIGVNGPSLMKVRYAVLPKVKSMPERWSPFWVFEGRVNITRRQTQGGSRSAGKDSEKFWGQPRRLFVPAWDLSLSTAQDIGSRLILQQPDFQFIARPSNSFLTSAVILPKDARSLLDFIILAIEARRKDWLKDLDFEIDVGQPAMWAMALAN